MVSIFKGRNVVFKSNEELSYFLKIIIIPGNNNNNNNNNKIFFYQEHDIHTFHQLVGHSCLSYLYPVSHLQ